MNPSNPLLSRRTLLAALTAPFFLGAVQPVVAAPLQIRRDIVFAEVDGQKLALDLFRPGGPQREPLIVWVHGGAWRAGSKSDMPLGKLLEEGFAVASVDYRLSTVAPFPAQAHDIKSAIRFLRMNASQLSVKADRIAIAGASAGGHLAAIVGVTNGIPGLEGQVGVTGASSDVQAIVSFFGMSDFTTILQQSTAKMVGERTRALELLLGGPPVDQPERARLASPVFQVGPGSPPLLLIHGDLDPRAPFEQSRELESAYKKAGRRVEFVTVSGGGHGGEQFYDEYRMSLVSKFLGEVGP